MNTWHTFPFCVEVWDDSVAELLALTRNSSIAQAAYRQALVERPVMIVRLRCKACEVKSSSLEMTEPRRVCVTPRRFRLKSEVLPRRVEVQGSRGQEQNPVGGGHGFPCSQPSPPSPQVRLQQDAGNRW